MKIGIVGSAGTGKTELGMLLAERMKLDFLKANDITRDILVKDGYDYTSGIQVERFLAQDNRQDRILKRTLDAENNNGSFVTDRTVIDLASYAVIELHGSDIKKVDRLMGEYKENSSSYTHLFVCPWGNRPLKSNGLRTLNPWYQLIVHSLCIGIMERWGLKYHVLESLSGEERVEEIMGLI